MTGEKSQLFPLVRLLLLTCVMTILLTSPCHGCGAPEPPHIVFIMADDMGWSDVSWNANDTYTPYLDQLRSMGVTLDQHYMQPACTASRVAFFTGYYPYKMGFQRNEMAQFHRWRNHSLSTDIPILSEYLRHQGYANHLVGKWQMGFCNWDYTPTRRGFESFYGSYGGNAGHFNHTPRVGGYDFRDNLNVDWSAYNEYSTTLYTKRAIKIVEDHHRSKDPRPLFLNLNYEAPHVPVECPKEYLKYCSHVEDPDRKTRCGMMAALDEGVQKLMETLDDLRYTRNLLLVFTSDNGAPGSQGGRNWPLRGKKRSAYEGGVRVPSFMYSKTLLPKQPYVYKGLLHVTDWLPTLLRVAQMDIDRRLPRDIDGKDQWNRIRRKEKSRRRHMVYDLDTAEKYAAVRIKQWKLVWDNPVDKKCWGWFNPPAGEESGPSKVKDCPEYQLFNLEDDPYEKDNLYDRTEAKIVKKKEKLLSFLDKAMKKARNLATVANVTESFPENWGGVWSPGWCHTAHEVGLNRPGGKLMDG